MKRVAIVVAPVLAIMAAIGIYGSAPKGAKHTEAWLEDMMLTEVGDYQLAPKEFGSKISYKMGDVSYEVLKPIGIACQIMEDSKGNQIDVVVIAGDSMEAFHDQKICFNAQGWTLTTLESRELETKTRGKIPITWMTIKRGDSPKQEAMYIFRTPNGFANYDNAKIEFLKAKIKNPFSETLGFSYRFVSMTPGISEKDLREFAANYIDKLNESTKGIL